MRNGTYDSPIVFDGDVSKVGIGEYFNFDGYVFQLIDCGCRSGDCNSPYVVDGEENDFIYFELTAVFRYFRNGITNVEQDGLLFDWDKEIAKAIKLTGLGKTPKAFRNCFLMVIGRLQEEIDKQVEKEEEIKASWPSMEQVRLN